MSWTKEFETMTVPELRKEVKLRGIPKGYKMNKPQLIEALLNSPRDDDQMLLKMMTMPELKKEAKLRGIPKYYKMRKAQLVEALLNSQRGKKI